MKKSVLKFITILTAFSACKAKVDKQSFTMQPQDKYPHNQHDNIIRISKDRQVLANIVADTVLQGTVTENTVLVGTLVLNPIQQTDVAARIPGRIETLAVRNPGEKVRKGNLLYRIYSEVLLAEESELANIVRQIRNYGSEPVSQKLKEASLHKLRLWGITEVRIKELLAGKSPSPYQPYYSVTDGIIKEIIVPEGAYVAEGSVILKLAKTNNLWVEAQLYPSEVVKLDKVQKAEVEVEGIPGRRFSVERMHANPYVEESKKLNIVHFRLLDDTGVQPGTMAYVFLNREGGHSLVVPKSAVLPEAMPVIWVKIGEDAFERRMVKTGSSNRRQVEILSGLKKGETVVVSGAYLINSEYILRQGAAMKHGH